MTHNSLQSTKYEESNGKKMIWQAYLSSSVAILIKIYWNLKDQSLFIDQIDAGL